MHVLGKTCSCSLCYNSLQSICYRCSDESSTADGVAARIDVCSVTSDDASCVLAQDPVMCLGRAYRGPQCGVL
jgi:hypothetical protein